MRWLSIFVMLLVGLGAEPLFGIRVPTLAILVIGMALTAWNLFAYRSQPSATTSTTFMELLVDLAAWASFLYLTGGATNPMASMLLPLVAVGATLLPVAQAWLLAGISISIYATLWFAHRPLYLPNPDQAAMWHLAGMEATFAVSAGVVVWYVSRLTQAIRLRDQTLAHAREQALRNERILALANQAASAAHELGTPLASMRLLVTELIPSMPDASTREDLQLVDQQIEQCKTILSRLTEVAGRARAQEQRKQPVGEWIKQQVQAVRVQRPDADVALRAPAENPAIVADAALDHALHNLLTNALKAAPDTAIDIEVALRGNNVDIRLMDRGPGIAAGVLSSTLPSGRKTLPGEGLGIGLLLTHTAIESHGGSLTYQRRPGGGTIAIMTLPTVAP